MAIKEYLRELLPTKIYTMAISYQADKNEEVVNVKKLIESLDYAYSILEGSSNFLARMIKL